MKNKHKYIVVRCKNNKVLSFSCKQINGFNLTKECKKKIKGVTINNLIIVNYNFIETVISKKINRKIKSLLELLASIYENDEDPGTTVRFALNEVEKFKRIVQNEYFMYMKKKQIEMLSKKVNLIESEIRNKLYQSNKIKMYIKNNDEMNEEVVEKSSHRRR